MSNELSLRRPEGHPSPFERIRRTNDAGVEFWSSRDFAQVLGYADYRNFEQVIQKAKTACFNSAHRIEDHLGEITEMIPFGEMCDVDLLRATRQPAKRQQTRYRRNAACALEQKRKAVA